MSFRTRLTSFFVLIVVVPMVGGRPARVPPDRRQPAGQGRCARDGVASAAAQRLRQRRPSRRVRCPHGRAGDRSAFPSRPAAGGRRSMLAQAAAWRGSSCQHGSAYWSPPRALATPSPRAPRSRGCEARPAARPVTVSSVDRRRDYAQRARSGPELAVVVRQGGRLLASTLRRSAIGAAARARARSRVGWHDYQAVDAVVSPASAAVPVAGDRCCRT